MIGELANVSVAGMLRLLSVFQQTGCLKVKGEDGEGELYLEQGVLVGSGAKTKKTAEEALRLLLLREGFFNFEPLPAVPQTVRRDRVEEMENLILEASRHCPAEVAQDYLPALDTVVQLSPLASQRPLLKLNLAREEWNFLTSVNGENSLQALLEKSGLLRERGLQAAYGLLAAGLMRKIRFRVPEIMAIASQELGNMGEALVRQAFRTLRIDPGRLRMRELIALLNELERNITLLLGPTRASAVVNRMWEGAKT